MANNAQVVCANGCGFRVHDRYYEDKKRFAPGMCARCNGPLLIVKPFTNEVIHGAFMVVDTRSPDAGRVEVP